MNGSQKQLPSLAQELKPLVVLYAEKYGEKDPTTGKPPLDESLIENLKTQVLEAGISADVLSLLELEIRKPDVKLMRARKSMREVKIEADYRGHIYHDKRLIAEKIIMVLKTYNNQLKDSLEN